MNLRLFMLNMFALLFAVAWGTVGGMAAAAPVYGTFFGDQYLQTGTQLGPYGLGAAWECWTRGVPAGTVTKTTVRTPLGSKLLQLGPDSYGAYMGVEFVSTALRDMAFPAGTYELVETLVAGGSRTNSMALAAGSKPPPATVLNAALWNQWPAGQPLEVKWQAGSGTLPTDNFVVIIQNPALGFQHVFESPSPGQPGVLVGTATNYTVPGEFVSTNGTFYVKVACYRAVGATPFTGQYAATLLPLTVTGQDHRAVAYYRFLTGRVFAQDGTNDPVLLSTNSYRIEAMAQARSVAGITAASIQAPGKPSQALAEDDAQMTWSYAASFASEGELVSAWPGGSYAWTIDGLTSGHQTANQTVAAFAAANPLRLLNLGELRTNSFDQDVVLSWTRAGGGAINDRIELTVMASDGEVLLRRPNYAAQQVPLTGTVSQLTIQAHALPSGIEMVGCLRYVRVDVLTTNAFGGAEGIAGRFEETRFLMGTNVPQLIPLEVLTTNLEVAAVAEDYQAQLVAVGGTRPYFWTLVGGRMPSGLVLETNGAIGGLPAAAGNFPLTFRVADATTNRAEQSVSLVVTGSVPALRIALTNLPVMQGSWPYIVELAPGGGLPPFTWELASGQLPPGLTLNRTEGFITGTPSQPGNFTFELRLRDGSGQSQLKTFNLVVPVLDDPPLQITDFAMANTSSGTLKLNANTDDPVSVEHSTNLVQWTTILTAAYPSNGIIRWDSAAGPVGLYRARWGQQPPTPIPARRVTAVIDTNLVAAATLTPTSSQTLALTNVQGHVYRLEVPTNAVLHETDVRMQFVSALGGSPFPNGYYGGVELRPHGLTFLKPATLTVTFPGGVPADYTPIAYDTGGRDLHLCLFVVQGNSVVLPVMHFSGLGGASASDSQASQQANKPPCNPDYAAAQPIAAAISQARAQGGQLPAAETLAPLFRQWFYWSVWPGLKMAQTDEDVLDYAVNEYVSWLRGLSLLGVQQASENVPANPPPGGYTPGQSDLLSIATDLEKCPPAIARGYANAIVKTHVRAVTERDPWIAGNMLGYLRSVQLFGYDGLLPDYLNMDAVWERLTRVWRFEVNVESVIDVNASAQFVEQVHSGRCPIEMNSADDWNRDYLTLGFQTNLDMVSWEYRGGDGKRTRPVVSKGSLTTLGLQIIPVYPEKEDSGVPDGDCPPPPRAPDFPTDAKITLAFNATDPVQQMEVESVDGDWSRVPVGNSWRGLLQGLRALDGEYTLGWPGKSGEPVEAFVIPSSRWRYSGGSIFAEATYEGTGASGVTERTLLQLFFAPKPLRASDTKLPKPL